MLVLCFQVGLLVALKIGVLIQFGLLNFPNVIGYTCWLVSLKRRVLFYISGGSSNFSKRRVHFFLESGKAGHHYFNQKSAHLVGL